MNDTTNDIDALLQELRDAQADGYTLAGSQYAALSALVAERNALREQLRLANIDQFNTEAESNDRDRELRERLIESALRGAASASMLNETETEAELLGRQAVWLVDGAIAEMRKGEQP